MAYLNLEKLHGEPTPEEALAEVFQRACNSADSKKLHLGLVGIHERADSHALAEQMLRQTTRKFSGSCKVWLAYIAFLLRRNNHEIAHQILNKAISTLPRRKHVKLISQAGLLEFREGSAERARGIFESILHSYPNRVDLWSVYIDQEVKHGAQERARALFERAITLTLSPARMKSVFKKYLEFEQKHGDEDTVDEVRQKAMEYARDNL
mmetsp:Transcript_30854/g.37394  ORF Transcript_30854/g.37394 Transcript_30854/m.37394 type:complete len:209 (+) Transcript_30854:3-629(+)